MVTAALFTIAKSFHQSKYPSTDEWVIVEYCSAIKRNGILIYATTWMSLKTIMLRDIKTQRTNTA